MSNAAPQLPTKSYDWTNITLVWGSLTGLLGGAESAKVMRAEDGWTEHVATDGTVTRVRNNNRLGGLEVVFGLNAPAMDLLSQQAQLDESAGTAAYPFELRDSGGRTVASGPLAWIKKFPDVEYGKEASTRTFVFTIDKISIFVGGLS